METKHFDILVEAFSEAISKGAALHKRELDCYPDSVTLPELTQFKIEQQTQAGESQFKQITDYLIGQMLGTLPVPACNLIRHAPGGRGGKGSPTPGYEQEIVLKQVRELFNTEHALTNYKTELQPYSGAERKQKACEMLSWEYPLIFYGFTIEDAQAGRHISRIDDQKRVRQYNIWNFENRRFCQQLNSTELKHIKAEFSQAKETLNFIYTSHVHLLHAELKKNLIGSTTDTKVEIAKQLYFDTFNCMLVPIIGAEYEPGLLRLNKWAGREYKFLATSSLIHALQKGSERSEHDPIAKARLYDQNESYFYHIFIADLLYTITQQISEQIATIRPDSMQGTEAADSIIKAVNSAPVEQRETIPFPRGSSAQDRLKNDQQAEQQAASTPEQADQLRELLKPLSGNWINGSGKIMSDQEYINLVGYTGYLIKNNKLPAKVKMIKPTKAPSEFIRRLFHAIWKQNRVVSKRLFCEFLHSIFEQFKDCRIDTISAHFADPFKGFDEIIEAITPKA